VKRFLAKWKPMVRTVATVFVAGCLASAAVNLVLPLDLSRLEAVVIAGLAAVLTWAGNALNPSYGAYGLRWRHRKL